MGNIHVPPHSILNMVILYFSTTEAAFHFLKGGVGVALIIHKSCQGHHI